MALDRMIERLRIRMPRNKRTELLETLGYVKHPGLPDGRATSFVQIDGGRPRLYAKKGHLNLQLPPTEVINVYIQAQTKAATAPLQIVPVDKSNRSNP